MGHPRLWQGTHRARAQLTHAPSRPTLWELDHRLHLDRGRCVRPHERRLVARGDSAAAPVSRGGCITEGSRGCLGAASATSSCYRVNSRRGVGGAGESQFGEVGLNHENTGDAARLLYGTHILSVACVALCLAVAPACSRPVGGGRGNVRLLGFGAAPKLCMHRMWGKRATGFKGGSDSQG